MRGLRDPAVAAALTDVLQEEGQESGGSAQGVHGCHVHHVGGEREHLHVSKGAALRPRADTLARLCGPPRAMPGGQRGELGGLPCLQLHAQCRHRGGSAGARGPPTNLYVATKSVSSSGSGARTQEQFTACG